MQYHQTVPVPAATSSLTEWAFRRTGVSWGTRARGNAMYELAFLLLVAGNGLELRMCQLVPDCHAGDVQDVDVCNPSWHHDHEQGDGISKCLEMTDTPRQLDLDLHDAKGLRKIAPLLHGPDEQKQQLKQS